MKYSKDTVLSRVITHSDLDTNHLCLLVNFVNTPLLYSDRANLGDCQFDLIVLCQRELKDFYKKHTATQSVMSEMRL